MALFLGRRVFLVLGVVVFVSIFVFMMIPMLFPRPESAELPLYYPTDDWRRATPEEAGMNADILSMMVADIEASSFETRSCIIVKDGYLVVEEYYSGFSRESSQSVFSCTKTVMGTLIGIAISEGKIRGVDEKLPDLLPGRDIASWMKDITLENLLTMSAGLPGDDWLYNFRGLDEMLASPDPLSYALTRPMSFDPGSRFEYTDAVSHILSCIITEKTGMSASEYAKEKLFEPLGVEDFLWSSDRQGRSWGYSTLWLRPLDMAKIGLLYMRGGLWEDKQIVPEGWIRDATEHRVDANLLDGYGYQIWVDDDGWYTALGYKGQFIMVFPELDTVAVFTGGTPDTYSYNIALADRFVIPAAGG